MMARTAHRGARLAVEAAHWLVNAAVLIAMAIAFAIGVYGMWDNHAIQELADSDQLKAYSPEAEGPGFEELQELNPDVQGFKFV